MNKYCFDHRSIKQFQKDIKVASIKEAEIAVRLCVLIHSKTGKWPKLVPNGVDHTGKFIKDRSLVNCDPDYKIDDHLVEITKSYNICEKHFHQKIHKVKKCIKLNSHLVFVNGYNMQQCPEFIWITPENLELLTLRSQTKYKQSYQPGCNGKFTNKPAYKYGIYWFKGMWQKLPSLKGIKLPKEYLNLLNLVKQ